MKGHGLMAKVRIEMETMAEGGWTKSQEWKKCRRSWGWMAIKRYRCKSAHEDEDKCMEFKGDEKREKVIHRIEGEKRKLVDTGDEIMFCH